MQSMVKLDMVLDEFLTNTVYVVYVTHNTHKSHILFHYVWKHPFVGIPKTAANRKALELESF